MTPGKANTPLLIDDIDLRNSAGRIGLSRWVAKAMGAGNEEVIRRHLAADIEAISRWGATAVITLLSRDEAERLGIDALPAGLRTLGIDWYHAPIVEGDRPKSALITNAAYKARKVLRAGGRALLHCHGGGGRAETVAARLLLELGECSDWESAIGLVRLLRPDTIHTPPQVHYVRSFDPAAHHKQTDATAGSGAHPEDDRNQGRAIAMVAYDEQGWAREAIEGDLTAADFNRCVLPAIVHALGQEPDSPHTRGNESPSEGF